MSQAVLPQGVPAFIYGTAWKEDETERLVAQALAAGFRGIDTANQRKHYHEAGTGAAVAAAIASVKVRREDLFLQTKFTFLDGQDHRLPYDAAADYATQVRQSFASSLEHLGVAGVDSYVLHGPSARRGLARADREVWGAMEELHAAGKTRFLGISNVAFDQLEELLTIASVRPAFVQNRCYARTGWDREVRALCEREGIIYQGFSLLTANARELRSAAFERVRARLDCTVAQLVFSFALHAGMIVLTGTKDEGHMREDLAAAGMQLSESDFAVIERIGAGAAES